MQKEIVFKVIVLINQQKKCRDCNQAATRLTDSAQRTLENALQQKFNLIKNKCVHAVKKIEKMLMMLQLKLRQLAACSICCKLLALIEFEASPQQLLLLS